MKNQNTLRWILRGIGNSKRNIVLLVFIQMALSICSIVFSWFLRDVVDYAIANNESSFYKYVWMMIGIVVFQILMRAVKRLLEEDTKSYIENSLKERLFSILLRKEYVAVTHVHSAEWIHRLTSDTRIVTENITSILPDIIGIIVKLIGAFFVLFLLIPDFMYIVFPVGLFFIVFTCLFRRKLKELHQKVQEADSDLRIFLTERLHSLLIILVFAKEKQTVKDAKEKMKIHKEHRMKKIHFSNFCNIGFSVMMNAIYMLGVIYCGMGILNQRISYGSFMTVLQSISQIQSPFASITGYLPKYYAMLASAERLMEAELYEERVAQNVLSKEEIRHFYETDFQGIGLENVSFSYTDISENSKEDKVGFRVLENVNLYIAKGEYVAFTGASGCGKSTLLKLLMGIYLPDKGRCYIESTIRTTMKSEFIRLFSYVPQGNYLMSGSIREIVAFFDREKMEEEEAILYALKIACADTFVMALKDGMDSVLGERGVGLSEGQIQRIAIARAVCSDNPILILDEATSALDEATERDVLKNLRKLTDKTVLCITHRLEALSICDRQVCMMESGMLYEKVE